VLTRATILAIVLATAGCSSDGGSTASAPGAEAGKPATATPAGGTAPLKPHSDEGAAPHAHGEAAQGEAVGPVVPLSKAERENIGLKTIEAARRPLEDVRRLPALIKPHPDRVAVVTSRTPGKVIEIHVPIGKRVAKGEDLIEVQSVEVEKLEIDLIQAENKYRIERARLELEQAQAENKLRLARADADRNRALVEKGIGARKELITAESQLQSVQNEIAGLQRQLGLQAQFSQSEIEGLVRQLELLGLPAGEIERVRRERVVTRLHILAPIGGVIVERPVSLGQIIDTSTALFRIVDDSIVVAEGDAFEDLLPLVRVGQRVRLTTAASPGRVFEGALTFIHPVIDPEKRTARVWAQIPNADRVLRPDMFAQLNVVVGGGRPVVAVPVEAMLAAEGQEFVFVEREGGFARVDIVTGARSDQWVEVKRGLPAGAKVVTDGKRQVYTKLLAMRSGGAAMGGHGH